MKMLFLPLFLCGCANLAPSPEQSKAMEGTQASYCVTGSAWNGAPVTGHYATFGGKSTGSGGGGGKSTCGASIVEFTNDGKAAKP